MIIILGKKEEAHANHIAKTLEKENKDFIFLDTSKYPKEILFNWQPTQKNDGAFIIEGKKIYFSDIEGIYWRNFYDVEYERIEDGDNSEFLSDMVERERRCALHSLFYSLDLNWVNSMNAFNLHKMKPYLTSQFQKNNIRVPKTLITNNEEELIKFYEENDRKIIFKPVLGGAYTQFLSEDDLSDEKLETLKIAPVQFQEFIEGFDIRVYAYKKNLYALKIESSAIDFREDENAKLIPIELPEDVKKDCFKIMEIADLKYSGIDIRLNNKGEYVFIEANPAPMFIHVENVTGYPLTQELIDLLCENKI